MARINFPTLLLHGQISRKVHVFTSVEKGHLLGKSLYSLSLLLLHFCVRNNM